MVWVVVAVAVVGVVVGLGHVRLARRRADVEAARRQIEALVVRRAALRGGPAADAVARHLADTRRIYDLELARYRATPGARINRWRPRPLPAELDPG